MFNLVSFTEHQKKQYGRSRPKPPVSVMQSILTMQEIQKSIQHERKLEVMRNGIG